MRTRSLRIKKIIKFSFVFSVFLFAVSLGTKLYLCSSLAVKNNDLEQAFLQRKSLEEEISKLSYVDSTLSAISSIEIRARQIGFVEMTERVLAIDPSAPVQVAALNQ
jgi:cell division protein FtsL